MPEAFHARFPVSHLCPGLHAAAKIFRVLRKIVSLTIFSLTRDFSLFFVMLIITKTAKNREHCKKSSGYGQVLKSDPRPFFHAASPLVSSVFGRRSLGLRPPKLLVAREQKPLVHRVINMQMAAFFTKC